jgi:hypothetical protein
MNLEYQWRYDENMAHKGDRYPTHGLVPLCQTLGVNRGDRLDYLVSLGSNDYSVNYEYFKKEYLPDSDPRKFDPPAAMNDMTTTLFKTVNGVSIMLQHDVCSPRPYNRRALISGTKGIMADYPFRCAFEDKCFDRKAHSWYSAADADKVRTKYMHPMWRDVSDMAKKVGGHGGMDFIMDYRLIYCLHHGLPLDEDVYDAAEWSCLGELTAASIANGGMPVQMPDFTRGDWNKVNGYKHAK